MEVKNLEEEFKKPAEVILRKYTDSDPELSSSWHVVSISWISGVNDPRWPAKHEGRDLHLIEKHKPNELQAPHPKPQALAQFEKDIL